MLKIKQENNSDKHKKYHNLQLKKRKRKIIAIRNEPVDDFIFAKNSSILEKSNICIYYIKTILKENKKHIIIIHGDPTKPNPILPGGIFFKKIILR